MPKKAGMLSVPIRLRNQQWDTYHLCGTHLCGSTVRLFVRAESIVPLGSSDFVQYTHHTALVLPTSDSVTHAELQALPRRRRLVVPGSGGRRTSRLAPLRMCWSRRLNGDHALARGSRCKSRARRASIASRRRSSPRSSAAAGRAPEAPWPAAAARSRRSRSAG